MSIRAIIQSFTPNKSQWISTPLSGEQQSSLTGCFADTAQAHRLREELLGAGQGGPSP